MKYYVNIVIFILLLTSCSSTQNIPQSGEEQRKNEKTATEATVKLIIESGRFAVSMDKLYLASGRIADIHPRRNYFIVNGDQVIVRLMYIGKSYSFKPVVAINFTGRALTYNMTRDEEKGSCAVKTRVSAGSDNFDFYLTINKDGTCSLSVINPKIQSVSYRGSISPVINSRSY